MVRRLVSMVALTLLGVACSTNTVGLSAPDGAADRLLAAVWVGFDERRTFGRGEEGARVALPIWTEFMTKALADTTVSDFAQPAGIVVARIDPATGLLPAPGEETNPDQMLLGGHEGLLGGGLEATASNCRQLLAETSPMWRQRHASGRHASRRNPPARRTLGGNRSRLLSARCCSGIC